MTQTNANPNTKHYDADDVRRLKEIVTEGVKVMTEIDDLRTGLSETVKAIAEEVGVKPSQLQKAIRIANKRSLDEERDNFDTIEDILDTVGRGR